jgi:hypothetical protein
MIVSWHVSSPKIVCCKMLRTKLHIPIVQERNKTNNFQLETIGIIYQWSW